MPFYLFICVCVWGGELNELPLLTERETEAMISGSKLVKAPHCWGRGREWADGGRTSSEATCSSSLIMYLSEELGESAAFP